MSFDRSGNPLGMFFPRKLVFLAYIAIGIALAANRNYLNDLDSAKRLVSALLAIVLWPLLLAGIDLHVR